MVFFSSHRYVSLAKRLLTFQPTAIFPYREPRSTQYLEVFREDVQVFGAAWERFWASEEIHLNKDKEV